MHQFNPSMYDVCGGCPQETRHSENGLVLSGQPRDLGLNAASFLLSIDDGLIKQTWYTIG